MQFFEELWWFAFTNNDLVVNSNSGFVGPGLGEVGSWREKILYWTVLNFIFKVCILSNLQT